MAEPSDTDWAYAAGFVDGEGCIAVVRSFVPDRDRYVYGVHVVVANRDRAVLDWMRDVWKGWVVQVQSQSANNSQAWHWRSPTGTSAETFLRGLRPWLRIKADQCDNALAMIELLKRGRRTLGRTRLPQAWLRKQEKLYWTQRQLNHRGATMFTRTPMHSPRQINRHRRLTDEARLS